MVHGRVRADKATMLPLRLHEEVAEARARGAPVLALESTLIAHGLPYPRNLETARRLAATARAEGAVPATIALLGGEVRVGLEPSEIERLASGRDVAKVSRRDLAPVLAAGGAGATTVAATMICAHRAGIAVFATGGIGGVHRGGAASLDISADLDELARTPVAVVASGAKTILDLPRTLEALETRGVPVVGIGTRRFPGFYLPDSGLALEARVDSAAEAARIMRLHWSLVPSGGLLFANPIPEAAALDAAELERLVEQASAEAAEAGIAGKALTPFLLARLFEASGGRALDANVALVEANVRFGAALAVAYRRALAAT